MKNRKYWYLKLESDFFNRHDIRYFLSSELGIKAVIVYEMLMLESISHEGKLRFNKEKPYTIEILHNIFFSIINDLETTKQCFKELENMDLIKWDKDKTLLIKGVEERIGTSTEQALYMQEYRTKKDNEKLQESLHCKPPVRNCNQNVITNVSLDIEKEKDIEIDIDKEKNILKKEKDEINTLQKFLEEIEMMMGRTITGKNCDLACKMFEDYGYEKSINAIKDNMDKVSPVGYAYKVLESGTIQEKVYEEQPKTYEFNDWLSAWKVYTDEEAPEDIRKKAKDYMDGK